MDAAVYPKVQLRSKGTETWSPIYSTSYKARRNQKELLAYSSWKTVHQKSKVATEIMCANTMKLSMTEMF